MPSGQFNLGATLSINGHGKLQGSNISFQTVHLVYTCFLVRYDLELDLWIILNTKPIRK